MGAADVEGKIFFYHVGWKMRGVRGRSDMGNQGGLQ